MSALPATPPPAAWDRALDGIRELGKKIDSLGERQESFAQQAVQDRQNTFATINGLDFRVRELERGATAAILKSLAEERAERAERWRADAEDRKTRRAELDRREAEARVERARRERLMVWLLAGLILAIILLIGVLIWLGLR